jgi:hypothetical protein
MELITSHINLLSNCMKEEHIIDLQNILESFGPLDTLFTKEYKVEEARIEVSRILDIIGSIKHNLNKLLAVEILMNFLKCNKCAYANSPKLSKGIPKQYTHILGYVKEKLGIENEEYIIKFYSELISPMEEIIGLVNDVNVCM